MGEWSENPTIEPLTKQLNKLLSMDETTENIELIRPYLIQEITEKLKYMHQYVFQKWQTAYLKKSDSNKRTFGMGRKY